MTVRRWERLAGAAVCILFAAFIVWVPSSGSIISLYLLTIIPAAAAVYMVLYVLMNYLVLDASGVTEVVWGKARRYPWESAAVVDDRIPHVSSRPHVGRRQLIVIVRTESGEQRAIWMLHTKRRAEYIAGYREIIEKS